jgi:hypothetical protein
MCRDLSNARIDRVCHHAMTDIKTIDREELIEKLDSGDAFKLVMSLQDQALRAASRKARRARSCLRSRRTP